MIGKDQLREPYVFKREIKSLEREETLLENVQFINFSIHRPRDCSRGYKNYTGPYSWSSQVVAGCYQVCGEKGNLNCNKLGIRRIRQQISIYEFILTWQQKLVMPKSKSTDTRM